MSFHGLLLSSGLSSKKDLDLVSEISLKRGYKKAEIVTTAHPKKENSKWNILTKQQLEEIGLDVSFIDFEKDDFISEDTDLLYVCGGNTFHLMDCIQKSSQSISKQIEKMCSSGGLYLGSSAGAVIVSPDISSASYIGGDKNKCGLKDTKGLSFVDRYVIPHYDPSIDKEISTFCEKYSISHSELILLRDGESEYILK